MWHEETIFVRNIRRSDRPFCESSSGLDEMIANKRDLWPILAWSWFAFFGLSSAIKTARVLGYNAKKVHDCLVLKIFAPLVFASFRLLLYGLEKTKGCVHKWTLYECTLFAFTCKLDYTGMAFFAVEFVLILLHPGILLFCVRDGSQSFTREDGAFWCKALRYIWLFMKRALKLTCLLPTFSLICSSTISGKRRGYDLVYFSARRPWILPRNDPFLVHPYAVRI